MSLQNYVLTKYLRSRVKYKLTEDLSIESIRQQLNETIEKFMPSSPSDLEISDIELDSVKGEWLRPSDTDSNLLLLYYHGGGFSSGSPLSHRGITCALASTIGAQVISIDYRLAPENPYPAAVEDALAAYLWLLREGVEPKDIALVGDQVGGALVLTTLMQARDAGYKLPSAGVTLSPWVDLTLSGESLRSNAISDAVSTKEAMARAVTFYTEINKASDQLVSPLFGNLTELPPIFIQVGESEILLDDATRLAKRLTDAGVEVEIDTWPDVPHMWQLASFRGAFGLPEGRRAVSDISRFLKLKMGHQES